MDAREKSFVRAARRILARLVLQSLAVATPAGAWASDSDLAGPLVLQDARERFEQAGVPEIPLRYALTALACARSRGVVEDSTLTLIDYSLPSTARRLWVLDAATGLVRFHEFVAHGRGSGLNRASTFSNETGSLRSSLGLFRTAETYQGRHGYSLRLDGLEPGINDRARERAIVMHGADYATSPFIARQGRLGRSWGCPAIDPAIHRELIDTIRGGTAVFAYYPDSGWLSESPYLACKTDIAGR